jgi:hypothetical protein
MRRLIRCVRPGEEEYAEESRSKNTCGDSTEVVPRRKPNDAVMSHSHDTDLLYEGADDGLCCHKLRGEVQQVVASPAFIQKGREGVATMATPHHSDELRAVSDAAGLR